jgi:anti-anti-sigma regulatory factor
MARKHCLPGELNIYAVGALGDQLRGWLQKLPAAGRPLKIDGSAVTEVDGAGLQLLVSLARTLGERDRRLEIVAPTATLVDAARALGLDAFLGLGQAGSAAS